MTRDRRSDFGNVACAYLRERRLRFFLEKADHVIGNSGPQGAQRPQKGII